ncbi:MAG: nucleotidyltransferase family protein [Lachnospiraceae bacterium]|nr:nucleotidyltransferase family protein [Lachnospiraceae bacterium]
MKNRENLLRSIRTLVSGTQPDLDSSQLTELAQLLFAHRCYHLLSLLKQPHPYTQYLNTHNLLNRLNVQERFRACQPLFQAFADVSLPYAVIKGAVLSATAYGNPYRRASGDIDLLLHRRHIDTAKQLLTANGFRQGHVTKDGIQPFTRAELLFHSTASHQTAPFVKATGNRLCPYVEVDVNLDILWGESDRKADMDFVLSQTMQTTVCDTSVRKLLPEMEFISLCLHHYKDMNSIYLLSHGSLNLRLFCDIYYYFKNGELNWDRITALCDSMGVAEYVYYCLYYTDCIFHDETLKTYCQSLCSPKGQRQLHTFGLAEDEIQEWDISFFDRLFADDFHERFRTKLPEKQLEKIRVNEQYMRQISSNT